jgi:hypothetical protein
MNWAFFNFYTVVHLSLVIWRKVNEIDAELLSLLPSPLSNYFLFPNKLKFPLRISNYLVLLFIVVLLTELTVRISITVLWGVPFFQPKDIIYNYYPMVQKIKKEYGNTSLGVNRVLVLSCSTLHEEWGDFENQLEEKLNINGLKFDVFNASGIGFSSLDNLNCYQLLKELEFDRVIFYGAINDARLGNCPQDVFKDGYTHYAWNNEIRSIQRHPELNITAIPFFLDYGYQLAHQILFSTEYIPVHYYMRPEWWNLGDDLKSILTFNHNQVKLIELAGTKDEDLLICSFASYSPENYSLDRFKSKNLDYKFQDNSRETEIWGNPEAVITFIDTANATSKSNFINQPNNSQLVDAHRHMKGKPYLFADICHFSPQGLEQFTDLLSEALSEN